MAKHGVDNFEFQIIEEYENQKEVNEAEKFWISFFGSRNKNIGYNLSPGGDSPGTGKSTPDLGQMFSYHKKNYIRYS